MHIFPPPVDSRFPGPAHNPAIIRLYGSERSFSHTKSFASIVTKIPRVDRHGRAKIVLEVRKAESRPPYLTHALLVTLDHLSGSLVLIRSDLDSSTRVSVGSMSCPALSFKDSRHDITLNGHARSMISDKSAY